MKSDMSTLILKEGLSFGNAYSYNDKNEYTPVFKEMTDDELLEFYQRNRKMALEMPHYQLVKNILSNSYTRSELLKMINDEEKANFSESTKDSIANTIYLCSLFIAGENERMWKNYGENGKGVMLVLDKEQMQKIYRNNLIPVSYNRGEKAFNSAILTRDESNMKEIASVKGSNFDDEKEMRAFIYKDEIFSPYTSYNFKVSSPLNKNGKTIFYYHDKRLPSYLKEIRFGKDCSTETRDEIYAIINREEDPAQQVDVCKNLHQFIHHTENSVQYNRLRVKIIIVLDSIHILVKKFIIIASGEKSAQESINIYIALVKCCESTFCRQSDFHKINETFNVLLAIIENTQLADNHIVKIMNSLVDKKRKLIELFQKFEKTIIADGIRNLHLLEQYHSDATAEAIFKEIGLMKGGFVMTDRLEGLLKRPRYESVKLRESEIQEFSSEE